MNFDNLVAKWGAERHAKGFRSKTQLISMLFCHLAGADSLREIAGSLNKLLSFDSTTISLCLSLFPWAEFRRAKGGVKVHVRAGS